MLLLQTKDSIPTRFDWTLREINPKQFQIQMSIRLLLIVYVRSTRLQADIKEQIFYTQCQITITAVVKETMQYAQSI